MIINQTHGYTQGSTVATIISCVVVIGLTVLAAFVLKRREIQPLKIKSPRLLFVTLIANVIFVVLMTLVQINAE